MWDRTTRVFHWLNVICILCLVAIGTLIMNSKSLDISGEGKLLLKTIHVYIGYVFVTNLFWRFVWCFIGNRYARCGAILPIGKPYRHSLISYLKASGTAESPQYLGHNPLGRLMVSLLFVLLALMALTGLMLAGTDLYKPPFGGQIAEWVAETDQQGNPMDIQPGSKEGINQEAYAEMRSFRKPFISIHTFVFYLLLTAIFIHIFFVIRAEIKDNNALVSAMITGKKCISGKPVDLD